MAYFLLAIMLLLCTVNIPQPVGAAATLSINITPSVKPGETYANSWAAAGPAPAKVAPPCGINGTGVRNPTGGKVECPPGASTGTSKSAAAPNGDKATAFAWATISNGVGTAKASVKIPAKPKAFAGAAAYAKANSQVPAVARGAGKVGGSFTVKYGNMTVNGWSEPADNVTLIVVDDLKPTQIPSLLKKVLAEDSINSLIKEGFEFAQPTKVYFKNSIVLQGRKHAKVKVGEPFYFEEDLPKCPTNNYQEKLQACVISEHSPSEKDFTPCKGCDPYELTHSLGGEFEVTLYIPGENLPENVSIHEISCVKSRRPDEPPPDDSDICSLLLHDLPKENSQTY